MADHKRKLLRQAAKRLLTGATMAGAHVFTNRPTPLWQPEIPAICIYTLEEPASLASQSPRVYRREPRLAIELFVQASGNCDDLMDDFSLQVEDILFANEYLKDPETDLDTLDDRLTLESSNLSLAENGQQVVMSNRMSWIAPYEAQAPQVAYDDLDDFLTAKTEMDIDGDGTTDIESQKSVRG